MIGWSLVVVALATLTGLPHQSHGMKMDVDGGYRDIVIKVAGDRSVPEEMCPKIISNIKVRQQNRFLQDPFTPLFTFVRQYGISVAYGCYRLHDP